jgi:hypothetical protein
MGTLPPFEKLVIGISLAHPSRITYWLVVSSPLKNISQMGLFFPIYGKITDVPNHHTAYKWGLPNIDVKYSQAPGQRHVSSDGFPLGRLHFFDIFKHLVISYIAIWKIWPIEISLIYRTEKDGDLTCKLYHLSHSNLNYLCNCSVSHL